MVANSLPPHATSRKPHNVHSRVFHVELATLEQVASFNRHPWMAPLGEILPHIFSR
ncbi:hypothetical protein [Paraburkholderia sp. MM5477-R1]|uniref:hypothetical protein n=1 Tax=Paraburkholderia sp. MM5477-R1 TaxID=2991062 RepID=UPI003D23F802